MLGKTSLVLSLLAASASSVEAFWRLPCGNTLVTERADSIVSPYKVSGHVHSILGASNFALGTTFDELQASECTSCLVKQDLSNYWTPQLYFQWANGSFTSVDPVGGGLIYYLPRNHPSDTTNVTAFPDDFRILTGSPFKRTYDGSATAQAIGWNCLGAPVSATRQPYLPPYNCPNGLRAEIRFPSCWNGVNGQSSDFSSHMAYPLGGESGPCPSTHPVRLVTLFYEIMWSVDPFNKFRAQALNSTQPFVLAQGDATGYGLHGDFFNGWDRSVLQEAIDTCTSDSGVIEYCKVFDLYESGHSCRKTPDVDEVVLGTLASLPGYNPVTGFGGVPITSSAGSPNAQTFNQTAAYNTSAPPLGSSATADQPRVLTSYKTWTYQDCYSDLVNGRALPNGLSTKNKTVEACLDACASKNYTMCGIEYKGECWGGNKLGAESTPLGAGSCGLVCQDSPLQFCGGTGGPAGASFELYTRPNSTTAPSSSSVVSKTSTSIISNSKSSVSMISTTSSVQAGSSTNVTSSSAPSSATTSVNSTSSAPILVVSSVSKTSALTSTITSSSLPSSAATLKTSTSAASTSTTSTAPAGPTKLAATTDWNYKGCYSDLVNSGRSLPNTLTGSSNFTVESCLQAAQAGGFAIAGLSYYGECYAGAALSPYSSSVDASRCNMACKNDATKTCGGSGVLDVYQSAKVAPLAGPINLTTFGSWSYDACYKDLVNNKRALPIAVKTNATIEGCIAAASSAGAQVAGLSYYNECYYSTTLSADSYVIPETQCRFACAGNPNEMCGGSGALSVWRVRSSPVLATSQAKNSTRATFKSRVAKRKIGRRMN